VGVYCRVVPMSLSKICIGFLFLFLAWNGVSRSSNSSDFQDYYSASQLFMTGEDIYAFEDIVKAKSQIHSFEDIFKSEMAPLLEKLMNQTGSYIYPPTFAFLLIPISILEYPTASLLFSLINFFSLVISCYIIFKYFQPKIAQNTLLLASLLALLLNFRFLENHVNNNQVGFLLLLLIMISITTKKNFVSGICLSLAIIIKLTPAVFLVYFFWKRRWSAIIYTFLFLGFWFLLPGIFYWDYNLKNWMNWNEMVLQSVMKTPVFRAWKNNQSMIATLGKYFVEFADPINQANFKMPWIKLEQETVSKIFNGIFVLFGFLLLHLLYKARILAKYASDARVISALFILSVIFSGISWIHTFCFFLFPILYLCVEYLQGGMSKWNKLLFFLGSILIILPNRNFVGSEIESFLLMVSVLLYAGISYFILLVFYQEEN
jgi:hypothetical protein